MPELKPLSREDLEEWAQEGNTGLVLHSVGNDHNLGAMARSAAFFDVKYIIISERDTDAMLTTSAYSIAEGGMEHITVRKVGNVAAFLKDASKCLVTVATDTRARLRIGDLGTVLAEKKKRLARSKRLGIPGAPAADLRQTDSADRQVGVVLVLGNEETGLPLNIKNQCSCVIRIPGTGNIQSLNVSQAAALFLHELYEL
jgi:TrmH RNA methyltransferase